MIGCLLRVHKQPIIAPYFEKNSSFITSKPGTFSIRLRSTWVVNIIDIILKIYTCTFLSISAQQILQLEFLSSSKYIVLFLFECISDF